MAIIVLAVAMVACTTDAPNSRPADVRDSGGSEVRSDDATEGEDASDTEGRDIVETDRDTSGEAGSDSSDAGDVARDGSDDADAADSRCRRDGDELRCTHRTATLLEDSATSESREVHWQVPTGAPPADGWPAVIVFQGAFTSSEYNWAGEPNDAYGRFHQVETLRALLTSGFAVLMPEALGNGSTYWQTNVPVYAANWESSADHEMMLALFEAIETGTFGELNADRLFAAGFSSGGYMTSRMAIAYTDRFEALAIHSGSYADCSSAACYVPDNLPDGHPSTLFLHGENDTTVPIWTMRAYRDELEEQSIPTRVVVDDSAGHGWIADAPDAIPSWFGR